MDLWETQVDRPRLDGRMMRDPVDEWAHDVELPNGTISDHPLVTTGKVSLLVEYFYSWL